MEIFKIKSRLRLKFDQIRQRSVAAVILRFIILFGLWLVFSGRFDITHLSFGILSVFIIIFINYRLMKINLFPEREEPNIPVKLRRIPFFLLYMAWEIILASLQVTYLVIHPKLPIKPAMVTFRTKLPSAAAKVVLGNSITITPGTLTLDIERDTFIVHRIIPGSTGSLQNGMMQSRVMKLYSDENYNMVTDFRFLENDGGEPSV